MDSISDKRIVIEYKNGKLSVNGTLENTLLCYGMLEGAKQAIADHQRAAREKPESLITPPPPGFKGS